MQDGGKPADRARGRRMVPRLMRWFGANARDLPWRRTRDPYAIWISEVMLQQTQVKTVVPYFERWMRELPDVASLAAAREQRVLKLWEGLGYYRRARHLQRAARDIMERNDSRFPREFDAILALPGVGRYTAGAVASIAFNHPAPIVDGNVTRVLARVFAMRKSPRLPPVRRKLWALAALLVSMAGTRGRAIRLQRLEGAASRVGASSALNQSLMELGALICTPRSPRCEDCPLFHDCEARKLGVEDRIPLKERRHETLVRTFVSIVAFRRGRVLVRQRPMDGVNGGMWEFPNLEVEPGAAGVEPARDKLRTSLRAAPGNRLCSVRHTIMRDRMEVHAFLASGRASRPVAGGVWVTRAQLRALPFARAHSEIREAFLNCPADVVTPRDNDPPLARRARGNVDL